MRTGIAVTRRWDYFGAFRAIHVILDDGELGTVGCGRRREFPLGPGAYSVEVEMDWCCSAAREVRLREGDVAELEAGLRWRGLLWTLNLLACFVAPGKVFVVRPLTGPPGSAWAAVREGLLALAGFVILFLAVVGVPFLVLALLGW